MSAIGHNRGPRLDDPREAAAARLREEIARLDRLVLDMSHARDRGELTPGGRMRWAPSRLAKCPTDRAILAQANRDARAKRTAELAPQRAFLARKLARITREIGS